ncbi:MAG: hypothetical protein KatS3mg033_0628 [Thermonema sp.]|nr:MAG: hypothetical protein KatS3mg033_0628 [Thermonema sp.]
MKTVRQILASRRLRRTAAREQVLLCFLSSDFALSQHDLEEALPSFDRVTLYRTLKTFTEEGIVHKIPDDSGIPRYALCQQLRTRDASSPPSRAFQMHRAASTPSASTACTCAQYFPARGLSSGRRSQFTCWCRACARGAAVIQTASNAIFLLTCSPKESTAAPVLWQLSPSYDGGPGSGAYAQPLQAVLPRP